MIQARFPNDDCGPLYISGHPVSLFAASVEPSRESQSSLAEERGVLHGLRNVGGNSVVRILVASHGLDPEAVQEKPPSYSPTDDGIFVIAVARQNPVPKPKDSKSFHKNCAFQRFIDGINVTEEEKLKTVVKGSGIPPSAVPAVRCAIETCKKHEEISLHSIFYDTKCLGKSPVVWIILNAKSDDPKQERMRYRLLDLFL
ncbi:hypothetical protein M422DRAFT_786034 [Sphaerobolus stellatus SS14]|uniref:Uncharacterized protein n=1 Tax=Sphaerobolus stellatus (strain SS14) TaxID=990650 RepID=A0A0C9U470_SPHS4|nr:hypothetical protein M422DRAFT_786034 [Sphaerobolus stellatus SS14]